MHLHVLDWAIVAFTLVICFFPALFFGKLAGKNTAEFFASGRSVPWWLAGLSMVGVRAHRRVDCLLLRAALAPFRRHDGSRVLRAALLGPGRVGRARLPR